MSDNGNGKANGNKLALTLVGVLAAVVVGALYSNDERIENSVRAAEGRIMGRLSDDRQERHSNAERIRDHELQPGHLATVQRVTSLEGQVRHLDEVLQREQDLKDDRLREALEALRREMTDRISTLASEREKYQSLQWAQINARIDALKSTGK